MWVSFGPVGLYRLKDGVWTRYGGLRDLPTSGVVIEFTDTGAASGSATPKINWLCSTGIGYKHSVQKMVSKWVMSPRSMGEDQKSGLAANSVSSSSITDDFIRSTLWIKNRCEESQESWRPQTGTFG